MNEQYSFIYAEPKTFIVFDDKTIIGFLNEEIVEDWEQPNSPEGAPTLTGYKYTGKMPSGGTKMPCEDPTDYGCVTNAIIRSRYSESEEMAIHRHYVGDFEQHQQEWADYNQFCEDAKTLAKLWLGIE